MVVGAQVQTPVALRTFAGAEVDGSRTQAEGPRPRLLIWGAGFGLF